MASRKALQGVAHNLAESFSSLMNWADDDYIMGHIVWTAWQTGATELSVDMLTGDAGPSGLLTADVARSQSDPALVTSACLEVEVDPTQRRPYGKGGFFE
ncbi:MAG: hypothetical protein AB2L09_08365 [Coriobacteriia bacterium]